jgi:hypothetical protein
VRHGNDCAIGGVGMDCEDDDTTRVNNDRHG